MTTTAQKNIVTKMEIKILGSIPLPSGRDIMQGKEPDTDKQGEEEEETGERVMRIKRRRRMKMKKSKSYD